MRVWEFRSLLVAVALVATACNGQAGVTTTTGGADTSGVTTTQAPEGAGDPEPTEQVTLTMWLFGDFGYDPLIEEYQGMHPNIRVETQIADFAAHHDALTTTLAAGSGAPDITAIEVGFIGAFKSQPQQFHNLLDFGAADIADRYLDWKWKQATTLDGSATIGLPTDVGGMAVCYRRDLFEQAGLPSDREEVSSLWGDSWADYVATGAQYTQATGRAFIDNANNLLYQAVLNQSPDTYYDAQGNLIYETSPQVKKAWEVGVQAIEAGIDAQITAFSAEWNAGMNNGDFAVLTCPAWMMGYIQGQAPDTAGNWDIADLPEGGGNWGGSFLAIPAQSQHAQEAYEFTSWLLAPEQQLKVFKGTGNFPSTPDLYEDPAIQEFTNDFFNGAPVGRIYAENALEVVAQNLGPDYETIDTEFENGLARVANGDETPEQAWETTIQNVKALIGQ